MTVERDLEIDRLCRLYWKAFRVALREAAHGLSEYRLHIAWGPLQADVTAHSDTACVGMTSFFSTLAGNLYISGTYSGFIAPELTVRLRLEEGRLVAFVLERRGQPDVPMRIETAETVAVLFLQPIIEALDERPPNR